MLLAAVTEKTYVLDLSDWPRWLVVLLGTILLAIFIWIGMKVLKIALWVLFFVVLIGGCFWAMWLLIN